MKSEPAFVTKILVPRRRPDTVRRARLLDMLRRGRGGDLIVLRAPAGFGKTTLLVDLAHEAGPGLDVVAVVRAEHLDVVQAFVYP